MPIEREALRQIPWFASLRSEDLSLRHVSARAAKLLLDQEAASEEGQPVYHLTQQEMAALVGTACEVVGRALKELEAQEPFRCIRDGP